MSPSETTQLGKAKKFSNYRCVRCHSYLIPLTEEKMTQFDFTEEQKKKVREHIPKLNYFCPRCMCAYQRPEKPVSEELANCPYCGSELAVLTHKGELTNALWCEECEQPFLAEEEELKKIEKLAEKTNKRKRETEEGED